MLIGNKSISNKHPGRTFTGIESNRTKNKNRFTFDSQYSIPNGYSPPYTWNMSQKTGDIGSYTLIYGTSSSYSSIAGGMNLEAGITGSGHISTSMLALVLSATCLIQSFGTFSSNINGKLEASSSLAGSGDLVGSIRALGNAISLINSSGSLNSDIFASGNISADLTPFTELSPESLSRSVWNALASDLNSPDTMGNKLNSAGAAGDPWSVVLPGSYTNEQAGNIISKLETLLTQIKALTAAQI